MKRGIGEARREIGKWLNEETGREIDRRALAELCGAYDLLYAELRRHIRMYRVADEAWNPEAEVDRLMGQVLEREVIR